MPIPTYCGDERSYVNVIQNGLNLLKVMGEYYVHARGFRRAPKYEIPR